MASPAPVPPTHPFPVQHFYALDDAIVELALHEPAGHAALPEVFVQDLWQYQRYQPGTLRTTAGDPVEVLDAGQINTDAGPDFRHARLRIGGLEWSGDVEIHVASGTWFDHQHHTDPRYNSVVLHVALFSDIWTGGLLRADGAVLPEVILYRHLEAPVRRLLYDFHTRSDSPILCAPRWPDVPDSLRNRWIDTLTRERVEEKTARLETAYQQTPDLETLLYHQIFSGLGYEKNTDPMRDLARRIPLSLARHYPDPLDLEALFAGASGLLPAPADLLESDRATADYVMDLRHRFDRIAVREDVAPLPRTLWQFFRLRPANFPPLRIAQGSALLVPGGLLYHDPIGRLLKALADATPLAAVRSLLHAVPGPFWRRHVRYEKATRPRSPALGTTRIDALIVNAVVPVLLLVARSRQLPDLEEGLFDLLRQVPAPSNTITRLYRSLGTRPTNAWQSQGLHQLYRTRCQQARCLACAIGEQILGSR